MSRRKQSNPKPLKREDEEWSDSEKTPSVSSGVEGGGSAVSSPIAPIVEEESSLPPPPRLNPPSSSVVIANSAAEDIRLRLSVLSEDARKRLASLTEDIEVARSLRDRHAAPRANQTRESSPKDTDEDSNMVVVKEEDCQPRSSSSSSSSTRRRESVCRRDSEDSSRRSNADETPSEKKLKLDDEAAPRLRLNASLATDPALRPAAVAALTVKPENTSPPNPVPPLPAGLQNGNYIAIIRSNRDFF